MYTIKVYLSKLIPSIIIFSIFILGYIGINNLIEINFLKSKINSLILYSCYLIIALPLYAPLNQRFTQIFKKLIFTNQYNYNEILFKLHSQLSKTTDSQKLEKILYQLFVDELNMLDIEIIIPYDYFNQNIPSEEFFSLFNSNKNVLNFSKEEKKYFFKNNNKAILVTTFLKEVNTSNTLFNDYTLFFTNVDTSNNLSLIILIGKKITNTRFSLSDYDFLAKINAYIFEHFEKLKQHRISTQINIAKRIQKEIIPYKFSIQNCSTSIYFKSCNEVGGDFFDYHKIDNNEWLILGDVTGLGIGAGMVVLMIQSIFSTLINSKNIISPIDLNYYANHILCKKECSH